MYAIDADLTSLFGASPIGSVIKTGFSPLLLPQNEISNGIFGAITRILMSQWSQGKLLHFYLNCFEALTLVPVLAISTFLPSRHISAPQFLQAYKEKEHQE